MAKDFLVYLGGPISGLNYAGATDWRAFATQRLLEAHPQHRIYGVSPMRAKEYLSKERTIGHSYEDTVLSGAKAITTRDRMDCQRADLVLINLLGSTRVSIGTMIEVGWADAFRVPIVLAIEPENLHQHPMLAQCAGFVVSTLEQAVDTAAAILLPGG